MAEMVKATLNGEFEIILPKHRADRPEWCMEEGWEKPRLKSIHQTTRPGDIVYYVGAEEGDMCGLLALWGAKLVLFEPNDLVWPNIKAIWEANGLEAPLVCYSGFAANVTDTKNLSPITLGRFPHSADGEVIGNHGFKELAYEADVIPQIKIDDLVEITGLIPQMISMDVEGAEFEVLKGAEQTLRAHKPRIYLSLHPEFLFRMFDTYARDVRDWIIALGYKETLIDYQHECHLLYEAISD